MTQKQCNFDGCDRPHRARGWCMAHYLQEWRGEELRPLSVRSRLTCPLEGHRICTECLTIKPFEEFYHRDGVPIAKCKRCYRARLNRTNAQKRTETAQEKAQTKTVGTAPSQINGGVYV